MPEQPADRANPLDPDHPWSTPQAEEPEPDWAEEIRQGRKARGDRLKEIFDGFADDPERPGGPTG